MELKDWIVQEVKAGRFILTDHAKSLKDPFSQSILVECGVIPNPEEKTMQSEEETPVMQKFKNGQEVRLPEGVFEVVNSCGDLLTLKFVAVYGEPVTPKP